MLYIGFLAYCALTVVSTTDRQIVLIEPAKLPIINVEVALTVSFALRPAQLEGAECRQADLYSADPGAAQLQGAKNITVEQLAKVRTLYEAESGSNLPAEIKSNILTCCKILTRLAKNRRKSQQNSHEKHKHKNVHRLA